MYISDPSRIICYMYYGPPNYGWVLWKPWKPKGSQEWPTRQVKWWTLKWSQARPLRLTNPPRPTHQNDPNAHPMMAPPTSGPRKYPLPPPNTCNLFHPIPPYTCETPPGRPNFRYWSFLVSGQQCMGRHQDTQRWEAEDLLRPIQRSLDPLITP